MLKDIMSMLIGMVGLGSLFFGLYQVSEASAYIALGFILIVYSYLLSRVQVPATKKGKGKE